MRFSQVFPIFTDGTQLKEGGRASSSILEKKSQLPGSPSSEVTWIPNTRLEKDGAMEYLKIGVRNNSGPANLQTLSKVLGQSLSTGNSTFLYIGDHGLPSDNIGQMSQADFYRESSLKTRMNASGLSPQNRDAVIAGWAGMKSPDDAEALSRDLVDGRPSQYITTTDISKLLKPMPKEKSFKFLATECYSGGLGWLAFDESRKNLKGNVCGAMGSTYYHASSGCSPQTNVDFGYGYWVAKGLKEKVDSDSDGKTSLFDLHMYAFLNDDYDQTPQLTTEIFLQERGFLSWPIDSKKLISESRDFFVKNSGIKISGSEEERGLLKECFKWLFWGPEFDRQQMADFQKLLDALLDKIRQENENSEVIGSLRSLAKKSKSPGAAKRAIERYLRYMTAEKLFLASATPEEARKYMEVRKCERDSI